MRILVTGGAGFIGSNFVHYWAEKYPEDKITVLDKLTYAGHVENIKDLINEGKVRFIKGDICVKRTVERAMRRQEVIVHFAAESHNDRSIVKPDDFIRTNLYGTWRLLDQARKEGIRLFHHVSTDEVFGSLPLDRPDLRFTEATPYAPHSPYSSSKAGSDHLVRAYYETYRLPITITNTSNNFGPYQDPEKLVPRFVTNILEGKKVPLMGNGENVRDWIYVLDHCGAIDLIIHSALLNPRICGETFCVGGNGERTNLQVTMEILRILGKDGSWIEHIDHRLGHDSRYAIDYSKIKRMLGWEPQHDIEEWFEKTVDWYKENQWWWRPLKEGKPMIDPEVQKNLVPGKERR